VDRIDRPGKPLLDASRGDESWLGGMAQQQKLVDERVDAACLLDAELNVVAANEVAAQGGVTRGASVEQALYNLAEIAERRETQTSLRLHRIEDRDPTGWLIELHDDAAAPTVLGNGAATHRLATTNLRLQEEVSRRRKLERQILAVAESEKQRISLELHDGLGQHLTGISFVARTLADKLRDVEHPEAKEAEWLVKLLNEAIVQGLKDHDVVSRLTEVSMQPEKLAPDQAAKFVRADLQRWTDIIKAAGLVGSN